MSEVAVSTSIDEFLEKDAGAIQRGIQILQDGLQTILDDLLEEKKFEDVQNRCKELQQNLTLTSQWAKKLNGTQIRPVIYSITHEIIEMVNPLLNSGYAFSQYLELDHGKTNASFLQSAMRQIGPLYSFGLSHTALFISVPSYLSHIITVDGIQQWLVTVGIKQTAKTNLLSDMFKQKLFNCMIPLIVTSYPEEGIPCQLEDCKGILREYHGFTLIKKVKLEFASQPVFSFVKTGETVLQKIPTQYGKPGEDIFGNKLEPVPVMDVALPKVPHCSEEENGLAMKAGQEGCLVECKRSIQLFPVKTVTPNEECKETQSVYIQDKISSEVSISTDEHCFLDNAIEGCSISTKGSVFSNHGIEGIKKSKINAGDSIRCLYIHQTHASASNIIECEKEIIQSNISAKRVLIHGKHGSIFGGAVYAWNEVRADVIGSDGGIKTEIHLGAEVEEIENNIKTIQREIRGLTQEKTQISQKLKTLKVKEKKFGNLMPEQKREFVRLEKSIQEIIGKVQRREKSKQFWQKNLELSLQDGRVVIAQQAVYPGTVIRMFDQEYIVRDEMGPTVFEWMDGISIRPYQD